MERFYRHFRYQDGDGIQGCYEVIGQGEDTENGIFMVAYRPLYKLPNFAHTQFLLRTVGNFTETVDRDGIDPRPRFRAITDSETILRCKEAAQQLYGN